MVSLSLFRCGLVDLKRDASRTLEGMRGLGTVLALASVVDAARSRRMNGAAV